MKAKSINYKDFFGVQAAALGEAAQRKVRWACVAIVGLGGVGSPAASTLAAAGVGKLVLIDNQRVTADNFNRLHYATPVMIGQPKAHVLRRVLGTRPYVTVK